MFVRQQYNITIMSPCALIKPFVASSLPRARIDREPLWQCKQYALVKPSEGGINKRLCGVCIDTYVLHLWTSNL